MKSYDGVVGRVVEIPLHGIESLGGTLVPLPRAIVQRDRTTPARAEQRSPGTSRRWRIGKAEVDEAIRPASENVETVAAMDATDFR